MRQLKIAHKITSRESLALDKYLTEISRIQLLTPEEEVTLAELIKLGDTEALDKLTRANLRFVVSVAKQYQNQGLSLCDLINEGNVGLMKAAKRFDETRGFKFISYAVWWIRQAILQAIVEHSRIVRMPVNKISAYNKVQEALTVFIQKFERNPSAEELSDILEIPSSEIEEILRGRKYLSFDSPISPDDDSSATMIDMVESESDMDPDDRLMKESLREEIRYGMRVLAPREVEILGEYYGLNGGKPKTLDEIGELFELTRERVRQIKERAIRRLRKSYNKNILRSFLG
jgi:RNA polymerase primary sigma factor